MSHPTRQSPNVGDVDLAHSVCQSAAPRVRTRTAPPKSLARLSLGLLGISAVAAVGLSGAGLATAAPQELIVVEHAATDGVTDTGASGDTAGDVLTFANEVFDAQDNNRIGSDQGMCVRTVPGKAWECFWTLSLASGQITVEGPFYDAGDSVLAITGGT
jgi:allene oxide cyclase